MRQLKTKDLLVGQVYFKDGVPLRCLDPFGYEIVFEKCEIDKRGNIKRLNKFVRLTESQLDFDF